MIIFVGDKPSPRMKPGAKPFEGAACEKRLKEWVKKLGGDMEYVVNSQPNTKDILLINLWILLEHPIVALGNNASKKLKNVPHFKLPHPSGLNRQTNDKKFIDAKLKECKEWLKSRS